MHTSQTTENNNWNSEYDQLIETIIKRGVHPVKEDNPDELCRITNQFLRIFEKAPEESKQKLATCSLFPANFQFKDKFAESSDSTRPLNYVMFCAHYRGLKTLMPYLNDEDLLRRGPYQSTFLHALIAGLEKESAAYGEPEECMAELLTRFPDLKSTKNMFGASPLDYLQTKVKPDLIENLEFIKKKGRPDRWGSSISICTQDLKGGSYFSYDTTYQALIEQAGKMEHLLKQGVYDEYITKFNY